MTESSALSSATILKPDLADVQCAIFSGTLVLWETVLCLKQPTDNSKSQDNKHQLAEIITSFHEPVAFDFGVNDISHLIRKC